jgi:BirA family biotin operon repressor/biotin-[acetyl-CoA-carboxylase] ligase
VDIHWFESLPSTQTYLTEALRSGSLAAPVCVGARIQTMGKGSRGNSWIGEEGNLFISLALPRSALPEDLKLESSSIYLTFLMKELLASKGSGVWLKWPNDFYLEKKKIGGVITNIVHDTLVCGIGINLVSAPENFGAIDISVSPYEITEGYCRLFENLPSWKQIFSKYQLEFEDSRVFFTHHLHEKIALKEAVLLEDGSLMYDGQRIYSLR